MHVKISNAVIWMMFTAVFTPVDPTTPRDAIQPTPSANRTQTMIMNSGLL